MADDRTNHRIPHGEPQLKAVAIREIEAKPASGRIDADVFPARNSARERADPREETQRATELALPRA